MKVWKLLGKCKICGQKAFYKNKTLCAWHYYKLWKKEKKGAKWN